MARESRVKARQQKRREQQRLFQRSAKMPVPTSFELKLIVIAVPLWRPLPDLRALKKNAIEREDKCEQSPIRRRCSNQRVRKVAVGKRALGCKQPPKIEGGDFEKPRNTVRSRAGGWVWVGW